MKIPLFYIFKNFTARKLTTGITVTGIALVVFVFAAVLMMAYGVEKTLIATGSDDNIIITRKADSFMASLQGLMQVSTQVKTSVNPITIAGWRDAFVDRMREDSRRLVDLCRHTIPAENQLLVASDRFVREVSSTVRGLYHRLGLPVSAEYGAQLDRTQEASRQRDRGYSYDDVRVAGFEYYDAFVDEITARSRDLERDAA